MRKTATILGGLAVGLTLACSTMTTSVDYDHTVNWSKYTTYQLMEGTKDPVTFTQKRIETAISGALNAKGMQPNATNPSLLVYSHVVLSSEKQYTTTSMGGFGYRGWGGMGGGMATTTQQNIPIGTLIVDMVDPNTKEMVWRGMAQDQVKGNGEDQGTIDQAVQKIFANFPPGTGKS